MPREQITRTKYTPTDNPSVVNENAERHVHLGFTRDAEWVQVGLTVTVAELEDMARHARAHGEKAALVTPEYRVDDHPFIVWSTSLDRGETNNLVRHARRARDGAFGRDE